MKRRSTGLSLSSALYEVAEAAGVLWVIQRAYVEEYLHLMERGVHHEEPCICGGTIYWRLVDNPPGSPAVRTWDVRCTGCGEYPLSYSPSLSYGTINEGVLP